MRCFAALVLFIAAGVLAACQPASDESAIDPAASETPDITPTATVTPIVTAVIVPTDTPTEEPTATFTAMPPTPTLTPTVEPTRTLTQAQPPTAAPTVTQSATATEETPIFQVDHYLLERPIPSPRGPAEWVDYIDRTYPYGATMFGNREEHIGVEFANLRFTPVVAAADGRVAYAGTDASIQFGPYLDYYGNLVVIDHGAVAPGGMSLYTLYAHLERISVATGDDVRAGDRIGQVGDSGIAEGPHLHFEVRLERAGDYRATVNPDLWIKPYRGYGTLAAHVSDPAASDVSGVPVIVRNEELRRETYVYGEQRVNSDPAWGENLTLGDLPAGDYEVLVSDNGRVRFREQVTINPGATTWLDIRLD